MGEPREKPRRRMGRLDVEVARLADRLRGRIGVGEHEAGEPPGERRLADPLPAPDQPGVREAALAIGREHFRFGALMADQRIDMARMGRAGERVGFGKIVGLAFLHASLALSAPAGSSLLSTADQMAAATSSSLPSGVDDCAAPRLGGGDVEERPPKGLVKGQPLRFEPVGRPRPPSLGRPLEADFRVEVEDQRQVGPVRADGQALERGDELRRQIARRALIGPGRIGEPVGNDPGSARERRQDRLVEMVDAGGGEQERLPGGAKLGREAGKDRLAQRLRARRASGLARPNDGEPERCEALLKPLGLNRLARALAALEGDETAPCLPGHRAPAPRSALHPYPIAPNEAHRRSFRKRRLKPRRWRFSAWFRELAMRVVRRTNQPRCQ